jgi:hypothetical protein
VHSQYLCQVYYKNDYKDVTYYSIGRGNDYLFIDVSHLIIVEEIPAKMEKIDISVAYAGLFTTTVYMSAVVAEW